MLSLTFENKFISVRTGLLLLEVFEPLSFPSLNAYGRFIVHDLAQRLHMPKVLCWDSHLCRCRCKTDSLSALDIRLRYNLVHQNLGACVPHRVGGKGWAPLKGDLCKLSRGVVRICPTVFSCSLNISDKQYFYQFHGMFTNSKVSWHILCLCKYALMHEMERIPRLPGRDTSWGVGHSCS